MNGLIESCEHERDIDMDLCPIERLTGSQVFTLCTTNTAGERERWTDAVYYHQLSRHQTDVDVETTVLVKVQRFQEERQMNAVYYYQLSCHQLLS